MGWIYFVSTCTEEGDDMDLIDFAILLHVRMAEWSKAPDSRINPCSLIRNKLENSGPRMRAWVQIPLLTNIFCLYHSLVPALQPHNCVLFNLSYTSAEGDIAQW